MKILVASTLLTLLLVYHVEGQSTWVNDLSNVLTRPGLPEDTPIGTTIGTLVHVVSGQRTPRYSTTSAVFSVEPDTGLVTLAKELNFRDSPTFTVDFYASIPADSYVNIQQVTVNVLPVNHAPTFSSATYSSSVREDVAVGSTVFNEIIVTDRDTGANGTVTVTCQTATQEAQLACQSFSVSIQPVTDTERRVIVKLAKALDYATKNSYSLQIQAADGGTPPLSDTATVTILVENVRDTRPVFLNTPIAISVEESAPTTADLGVIQARRAVNSNNNLTMRITSDPLNYFTLDPVTNQNGIFTARIRTTGRVNREDITDPSGQYYFVVTATEVFNGQPTQVSSDTTVTVQVIDINNNAPTFNPTTYAANVTEGMPSEAIVPALSMVVEDKDVGDNGYYVLEVTCTPLPADTFGVFPSSGSGKVGIYLTVLRPDQLVYDDPNKRRYTVTVTARETRTTEKRFGTATVVLTVLNPNNQPTPFFQSIYPAVIVDNRNIGDVILTVSVSDTGAGSSSGIRYAITAGNEAQLFTINPTQGLISVAKALNATANPTVTLTVSATNRFGLVSYATVQITIRDSKSQGPQYQLEPYVTTVDENGVNLIPRVMIYATPLKTDKVVRYRIVAGNPDNLFSLNKSSTNPLAVDLIMNRGVDYNETPNRQGYFLLTIEAADDVVEPLFTNTSVIINIRDSNNHPPTFLNGLNNATYSTTVTEVTAPETPVQQLNASDLDAGENSRISYIMGFGSKDNFVVDYTTGLIKVASLADLSIKRYGDQYNLTVYAIDHGSPPLTGTAMVYIHVNSSIYQTPIFDQQEYVFTIYENSPINQNVGGVRARALDAGAQLQYLLDTVNITAEDENGNDVTDSNATYNFRNSFSIDPTTGIIKVAGRLNRKYAALIQFDALANITNPDRATPAARVHVRIYILSNLGPTQPTIYFYTPPLINGVINVSIFETPTTGGQVTQFGAVYGTGTPIPVTDYRFGQINDPNNLLAINSTTGALTVAKPIVYDSITGSKTISYEIIARAPAPNNLTATATINVAIRSLSEGRPVFSSSVYNFSVREDASMGYSVGKVQATLKVPGQIQYRLSGVPMDFSINPDTGEISVKNQLDAETRQLYILTASTVDKTGLGQIQSVSALVYINVLDVNERGPQFLGEPYNVVVYDTTLSNTTLIQVQAVDTDVSQTRVTYTITGGNDKGLFQIDPNTGLIKPTKGLSGQSQSTPYEIIVTATDSGSPTKSSTTTVNILIRNQTSSGGPPSFIRPADGQNFNVYERRINEVIVQAEAVSNRPAYPNITYGLYDTLDNLETNKRFNFNSTTGLLTTAVPLNRTERSSYDLILQALDSGAPALVARISISLNIFSDAPPTFTSCPGNFSYPEVTAYAKEKQEPGQYVTKVTACSYDINPTIYYYITAGNESYQGDPLKKSPFSIDKKTGVIRTNEVLEWYVSPVLYLNVTATTDSFSPDSALNTPGATITVRVIINGTDANGPKFDPNPEAKEFCRGSGKQSKTGILDITGFGVRVIQFIAGDCDSPEYRNHTFTIESVRFIPPNKNENSQQPTPQAFTVDPITGWVLTGETSYRKYTDGTFMMTIRVSDNHDPVRSDTAQLTVYIIRESQRLRYVFDKGPKQMENSVPPFVTDVNKALNDTFKGTTDISMISDVLRLHVDQNADVDFMKSDLCFHVLENDKVLNVAEVKTAYGKIPQSTTNAIYTRYDVVGNGTDMPIPCNVKVTTKWWSHKWFLWWLLIALALFIWVIALLLIICVCVYWPISRRNYFKSRPYVVLDDPPVGNSEFEWQGTIHRVD